MLQSLSVKDFAIIDNINIDFGSGFNAITGETGAGKSLLIDAIGLLLGEKASPSMVRTGSIKAVIEGVFTSINAYTKEILENYELLEDDDLLIIRKEIYSNGKSITRINGLAVNVSVLSEIADTIADIHTQNDTKKLFEPKNYLTFIDNKESLSILKEYQVARTEYLKNLSEYENIKNNLDNFKKDYDYLEYQYNVLKQASLKKGELKDLEEELNIMSNYEVIHRNLASIKKDFNDYNINNGLYQILNSLDKVSSIDSKYQNMHQILSDAYYEISDIESTVSYNLNNLEFDNDRYTEVSNRINQLHDLSSKYKKSIDELIVYRDELANKLENYSDSDYLIKNCLKKVESAYNKTKELALKLSNKRQENAKKLTSDIKDSLVDLMLSKVQISIVFESMLKEDIINENFTKNGIDKVNIMISFNPGEELKELSKVASGGEMSRVMLAIKTHLMSNLKLSTMIFDEIDSGISGEVAYQVALKLKDISKYSQVLAITHLPIVASLADEHMHITKSYENNLTKTMINKLNYNDRVNELAKLISPNDSTNHSKELAMQMLNNN